MFTGVGVMGVWPVACGGLSWYRVGLLMLKGERRPHCPSQVLLSWADEGSWRLVIQQRELGWDSAL